MDSGQNLTNAIAILAIMIILVMMALIVIYATRFRRHSSDVFVPTAAWLRAAYRTVAQPAAFATYGPVENALEPDADGDAMPDAWERTHFGNTERDGDGDWDGDGLRDGEEYVAKTETWSGRESGTWSLWLFRTSGDPLVPATYELHLYIEGKQVQSATFVITE